MNDRREWLAPSALGWLLVLAAAPAHASGGGLKLVPDVPLLLLLLVVFVLLIFPTNALLFRPIFRVLDARDEKISGTRRNAERLTKEAEAVAARYEEAIGEARVRIDADRKQRLESARHDSAEATAEARQSAESELERARGELTHSLETVRGSLASQVQELAREAAARLLGRPL